MLIDFQVIPHRRQRYDTCGDYYKRRGWPWTFRVSRFKGNKTYPILIFLHEIIEFFMCRLAGVRMAAIDKFDIEYEKHRPIDANGGRLRRDEPQANHAPCGCQFYDVPGDDPHAPYYLQHQTATACEKLIAKALGVDWEAYNNAVESL